MNLRRLLAAGAAVALAVTACGGESEEETVAEAIASDLRGEDAFADDITEVEARCVGDAIVADLGADEARTLGRATRSDSADADPEVADRPFDLASLSEDEIATIGGSMEDCVDELETIVVDLVAQGILAAPDEDFPIEEPEARCVGESVASEIAFSRLLSIGLESEEGGDLGQLEDGEATVFGAAFSDCVDVRTILLDQVSASGADDEVVACLDEQISDEAIEMLFVDTFAGDEASAEDAFADAIDVCT